MTHGRLRPLALTVALVGGIAWSTPAREAEAFCGFYVAGADSKLYNDATMVVLMRDGTTTVLSMQNSYKGPPEDFALVVPVPVVLQEDHVQILPQHVFDRIDKLAAPRLVEYWEVDPCHKPQMHISGRGGGGDAGSIGLGSKHGVKVEAQFDVGEYDVVILSAEDSTGLDTWLREEHYTIPTGAEPLLRPYVQSGYRFFVAKVDIDKLKVDREGRGVLSPLRIHYESETFSLPIRLGLINSSGTQDLIVHILAPETRYEAANYSNVAIPSNIDVVEDTRADFGSFYAALFDATLAEHPGAVVTEYAWTSGKCDPCPISPLTVKDLATFGLDVLPGYENYLSGNIDDDTATMLTGKFALTRLHARYDADSLGNDLVFRVAPPITGGRERFEWEGGLERGATVHSHMSGMTNNFQARYVIRHPWTGKVRCKQPRYGIWGGPWEGEAGSPKVARQLAFVDRGATLSSFVNETEREHTAAVLLSEGDPSLAPPALAVEPSPASEADETGDAEPTLEPDAQPPEPQRGCAHCSTQASSTAAGLLGVIGLLALFAVRRRRRG